MNQDLLTRCSNAAAPSGFEGPVRSIIRQELGGITQITTTTAGNIICELPGSGGPTVALLSHMDEIGFMVQGITPDGFLLIVPLGGWWNHTLPSQRVRVHTRAGSSIPGQISFHGAQASPRLPLTRRPMAYTTENTVPRRPSCAASSVPISFRTGAAIDRFSRAT